MFYVNKGRRTIKYIAPFIERVRDRNLYSIKLFGKEIYKRNVDFKEELCPVDPLVEARLNQGILNLTNFRRGILAKAKNGRYNIILHRHIGDSFVVLNLLKKFKSSRDINVIINKRHECLMELFPEFSYETFEFSLSVPEFEKTRSVDERFFFDSIRRDVFEKLFPSMPLLDVPFILSPIDLLKCSDPYANFVNGWGKMLGLDIQKIKTTNIKLPIETLSSSLLSLEIEKTILICPDANSQKDFPEKFWEDLIDKLMACGYHVLINSLTRDSICNVRIRPLSLRDAIIIGQHCYAVISLRSGLADILIPTQKRLIILNPVGVDRSYLRAERNFYSEFEPLEISIVNKFRESDLKKIIDLILLRLTDKC